MVPRKKRAYQLVEWVGSDKLTLVDPAEVGRATLTAKWAPNGSYWPPIWPALGLSHRGVTIASGAFKTQPQGPSGRAPKNGEIPFMLGMTTEFKKQRTLVGVTPISASQAHPTISFRTTKSSEGIVGEKWKEHVNTADERLGHLCQSCSAVY